MIRLNDEYHVRKATAEDVPRIADIWIEGVGAAFGDATPELPARSEIESQLLKLVGQQSSDFKFWLCVDAQGAIDGWSTVQPFHTTPLESARNSYGFLSTYMSSNCRGKGLGSELVQFVMTYCKEHTNICYVLGLQDRSNAASVKITDRAGFRDFGRLPRVQGLVPCSIIACLTAEEI
jgi:L-amino acid N-acyltransferase YncA